MYSITAYDIDQWAGRLIAKSEFPRLVRRLIYAATHDLVCIEMHAGEGVQRHGFDGIIECTVGNAIVPSGISVWEIGTDQSSKSKADEEYRKRSNDSLGRNPRQSTFIFVTPRNWPGKTTWEQERNTENVWKRVRAYDAQNIEQWLEEAPSVAAWFGELIGKRLPGLRAVDEWWNGFVSATEPSLNSALVIAGRHVIVEHLVTWFSGAETLKELKADSPEEGLAFVASVLDTLPDDERDAWYARSLVVENPETCRSLLAVRPPLLLILPQGSSAIAGQLIRAGHRVLLPIGREMKSDKAVTLPRPSSESLTKALIELGLTEAKAKSLTQSCGRSIQVLRRRIAVSPALAIPEWAQPGNAGLFSSVLLAGAWNGEQGGDKKVLEGLAGKSYNELEKSLTRWQHSSDPPLRHVATVWQLTAPLDAWLLLGRYLTSDDLRNYRETVLSVLSTPDPRFDLEPDNRWAANIYGKSALHSGWLKKGLIEGLILIAIFGEQAEIPLSGRPESWVFCIIRDLLKDASGLHWGSLHNELPLLAEASPEAFLDAVEDSLKDDSPTIMYLFQSEGDMGACLHSGLLWALEALAWSPRYLARVTLILGALSRLDPGGKWSNRPFNSLKDIYLSWKNHTAATLEQKLESLHLLLTSEPEIGWKLLVKLLPSGHETTSGTYIPRWRDWALEIEPSVTVKEHQKYILSIVDRLMTAFGDSGKRRIDMLKRLSSLPENCRDVLIADIEQFSDSCTTPEERTELWNALRSLLNKHRQFPDAQWSLPSESLDRLELTYSRLEPEDEVERFTWLFENDWPLFPDGRPEDHEDFQRIVAEARRNALHEIYRIGGIDSLSRLVRQAEQSYHLGLYAAEDLVEPEIEHWVLEAALGNDEDRISHFALAFVGRRQCMQEHWFDQRLEQALIEQWGTHKLVQLCLALPLKMESWELIERLGIEVKSGYWAIANVWSVAENKNAVEYAATQLLKVNRPEAVIGLIRFSGKSVLPFTLLVDTLEMLFVKLVDPDRETNRPSSYDIEEIFLAMDKTIDKDENRIAQLEWRYMPLLRDSERGRGPKILHQTLNDDPLFFAQVLCWMYKPENSEREDEGLSFEELSNRAHIAHDLLHSWKGLPGGTDACIDEVQLVNWVFQAKERLLEIDRKCLGEQYIGQMLSWSPTDNDGIWPAMPVRKIIESLRSHDLEVGIYMGVFNNRGFTSRSFGEGGNQERNLEARYREWAERTAISWPMTSRMLNMIANSYASHAKDYDLSSAKDELRFG